MGTRAQRCERAREWISLQADGELSELERAMLRAHLVRCGDCRTFRADVQAISLCLRESPLERLERPVILPRSPRFAGRAFQFAAAGAAAIAVGVGSTFGVMTADHSTRGKFGPGARPAYLDSTDYEMQLIRHAQDLRLFTPLARVN